MPAPRSHTRQAGVLANLIALALLTLPLPTHADQQQRGRGQHADLSEQQSPPYCVAASGCGGGAGAQGRPITAHE